MLITNFPKPTMKSGSHFAFFFHNRNYQHKRVRRRIRRARKPWLRQHAIGRHPWRR